MANSLLTAQWVARKALILMHAKANMTGRTNRDYQSLLPGPIEGVILGQVLSIRLPYQYTLRTGSKMQAQNSVQRYAQLSVSNQNGVDINFTSVERAMQLNNFEEQVLQPAMARVSAGLESNVASLVNSVPKYVGVYNTSVNYATVLQAERFLTETLTPEDDKRTLTANPQASYEFVLDNKALFNPSSPISDEWLEGVIADKVAGFSAFRNTKLPTHTIGGSNAASTPVISTGTSVFSTGAGNAFISTSTLVITGTTSGGTTATAGDVVSITNLNDVDPETKVSLGRQKQFVVQAAASDATGVLTIVVAPGIITGGAYQNVDSVPVNGNAVQLFGQTGFGNGNCYNQLLKQSLAWYKDAIVFANPSMLDLSELVKFTAAESFEGYNIRFAQQWDPDNDLLPGRLDTISGEVLAYPELAVRLIHLPA
jgi:P22 coat protein - gene protein 5